VIKIVLTLALVAIGQISVAQRLPTRFSPNAVSFMPENRLNEVDNRMRFGAMTEADFNAIIDQVVKAYAPVVASFGAQLVVERNWTDSTVNAYASQEGKTWKVAMFGGLARRPEVTADGFAMVVCHELGHHLGGYVFKGTRWAAAEGQSDYFATQICARAIWGFQSNVNMMWRRGIRSASTAIGQCDSVWPDDNSRGWCYRTASAAQSLATLLSALSNEPPPSFETPDTKVVATTDINHPHGQCRLDTYLAGALCTRQFNSRTIPGKTGDAGSNTLAAEMESAKSTCFKEDGYKVGFRPMCWFRSVRDTTTPASAGTPPGWRRRP
jgi:hypothetical protein